MLAQLQLMWEAGIHGHGFRPKGEGSKGGRGIKFEKNAYGRGGKISAPVALKTQILPQTPTLAFLQNCPFFANFPQKLQKTPIV